MAVAGPAAADLEEDQERARRDEERLARIVDLVATGSYGDALAALDRAGEVAENDPRWLNLRGLSLAGLGRHGEAVSAYERGLRRDPGLAALHRNLAISLVEGSARGRALSEFRQAVELDPGDAEAWLGLAALQVRLRRLEDARESLDRLGRIRPDDPRRWRVEAEWAERVADPAAAKRAWRWLEEHVPDAESARRLAGFALVDDPERALGHYRDCFGRDPDAVDCRERATQLALASGRPALAVEYSEPALDALGPAGYLNLLLAASQADRIAGIEDWVDRRPPATASAWGVVALARRADGRPGAALAAVRAGLEVAETADLYNLLGVLEVEAGDADAARTAWRQALEIDPDHGPARDNLAEHPRSP